MPRATELAVGEVLPHSSRILTPDFDAVPSFLRELGRWVLWRLVHKPGAKKPTKVPFDTRGSAASSTNAATWSSFDEVRVAYEAGGYDGIGFVFVAEDRLVGVDLDHCIDPETGELAADARATVERLQTYAETSPSGHGVHLILRGTLPPGGRKRGPVEAYSEGRYFTITARPVAGVPMKAVMHRQAEITAWHAQALASTGKPGRTTAPAGTTTASDVTAPPTDADDRRLLERARGAKNGAKFRTLFDDGDCSAYPSQSEADLALCMLLAFWTRRDGARIDRLYRRSALFRPKWDAGSGHGLSYGQRTVRTAIERSAPERAEVVFSGVGGDIPLHKILPSAVAALADRCAESVYTRGDVLARVIRAVEPGEDGIERSAAPRIVRLPDSILKERLDEAVAWIREKKNRQGDVVRLEEWCPRPIVEAVRDRADWPGVRPVLGVVTAPTMRPDGSVLDRPGYDPKTALIYEPARVYPTVPPRPTEAEVAAAYRDLLTPFQEFPFPTPADEAAVAALMLQIASRYAIAGPVPMTVVVAPEFGSGKTLLARAAAVAMTGHGPDEMPPVGGRRADGESEMRKRLTTVVMEAPRVALLDNVPDGSTLESPSFAALLTCGSWTDRVLGVSRNVTLPHRVVWVATGNNIRLAGDLARRSLSIQIEPGVERPSLRMFKRDDLLDYVAKEHPRLLVAALTVMRGFHVAGRPGHGRPPLGMFTAWDGAVRAAVVWAHRLAGGEADPLDTQGRLVGEAPDKEVLAALLAVWQSEFAESTTTAGDAVRRATTRQRLQDAVVAVGAEHAGKPDARRMGKYLQRVAGRVVDGLVFERRGARDGVAQWGLRVVDEPPVPGVDRKWSSGVSGVERGPSSFVYARAGRAGAGGRTDLQHSTDSSDSTPRDPIEAAEREAIRADTSVEVTVPTPSSSRGGHRVDGGDEAAEASLEPFREDVSRALARPTNLRGRT